MKIIVLQLVRMHKINIRLYKCYCEHAERKYLYEYVLGKYINRNYKIYLSKSFSAHDR